MSDLPKALARQWEETVETAVARLGELERSKAEADRLVAEGARLLQVEIELNRKTRERAVELEEEKQLLEKQIEGYILGLRANASNPQHSGLVRAMYVIDELKRIIGQEPSDMAAIERDKAIKRKLTDTWDEPLTVIAAGMDKVSTTEAPIRLPVPATVRRQGGLGPVIIAAEYVANQWEMGNAPSEESLETLCKAMKLYSILTTALDKGRCKACGQVICQCPEAA